MSLADLTIVNLQELIRRGVCTPLDIHRDFRLRLDRLERKLNAFIRITRAQAERRSEELFKTFRSSIVYPPLFSVPGAIKDNIVTKGIETTCASQILEGYIPPYNATVISRLNEAGYILMGKLNLDEFAMGFTTETSAYGPTLNPYDISRVAGGSSGGSAAAVAAGMVAFALGSDTGGSVRQPASFCNVVGFKPSYGRLSRYGLVAFASSLDQIGILTKTIDDTVEIFKVIAGYDPMDSTSIIDKNNFKPGFQDSDWQSLKIGYLNEIASVEMDPSVKDVFENAVRFYESKCGRVRSFSFPLIDSVVACYYIIAPSECSANLARYDGIRYGPGLEEGEYQNLLDYYFKVRGKGFGDEVRRRILVGTFALCSGYYDAYYLKANQVRSMIIEEFEKIFKEVDILISPTYPVLPLKVGRYADDPIALYNSDLFTIPSNLCGYPSISIPGGFSPDGLPIGIMLMSRYKDEDNLLRAAKLFERHYPFYKKAPVI